MKNKRGKFPGGVVEISAVAAGGSSPMGRGRKNMSLACKAKLLFFQVRG
jgi:hypothetical protein